MRVQLTVGLTVIVVAACASGTSTAGSASQARKTSPTASPASQSTPRLLVALGPVNGQNGVLLLGVDGRVVASTTGTNSWENVPFPGARVGAASGRYGLAGACCGVFLPEVSVSDQRVYFTAGQDEVRYLGADGTSGLALHLPNVKGRTRSVFAVRSDDARIAFSVFDWSGSPMTVHIFVEDIGGGNQVEIFSSSSAYEWPVAWHGNDLVVGAIPVLGGGVNPYAVKAYHVVNASTGARIAELGSEACPVTGPLVQAGTACTGACGTVGCVKSVDWSGNERILYRYGTQPEYNPASLSPNGSRVAITDTNLIASADGSTVALPSNAYSTSHWWLDDDTLAIAYIADPSGSALGMFRLSSGQLAMFPGPGQIVGALPGGLS